MKYKIITALRLIGFIPGGIIIGGIVAGIFNIFFLRFFLQYNLFGDTQWMQVLIKISIEFYSALYFSGIIAPKIVNAKVFYLFWLSFMALGIVGSLSDSFYENPVDGYASSLGYLLIYISFWKQNKGLLPRYSQASEKNSI